MIQRVVDYKVWFTDVPAEGDARIGVSFTLADGTIVHLRVDRPTASELGNDFTWMGREERNRQAVTESLAARPGDSGTRPESPEELTKIIETAIRRVHTVD